jgi:hypothetical protein
VITLCSPHHGSALTYLANLPVFKELRKESEMLRRLNRFMKKSSVPGYCTYDPYDLVVVPGWSGKTTWARENLSVPAPLHQLAFAWPSSLRAIKRWISENE